MNAFAKAAAVSALLLVAGCTVSVDNKTQAQLDNSADTVGAEASNLAAGAAATAEQAGNAVERGADAVDNGVSVHVNLHADDESGKKKH